MQRVIYQNKCQLYLFRGQLSDSENELKNLINFEYTV